MWWPEPFLVLLVLCAINRVPAILCKPWPDARNGMRENNMGHMYKSQGVVQSRSRSHLGHGNDVWDNSLVLEAPVVGARPAKASLHLVCYAYAASFPHHLHSTPPKSDNGTGVACKGSAQASLHLICYAHAAGCMHHLYSMPISNEWTGVACTGSAQASLHLICYAHAAGCMHHLYSMPISNEWTGVACTGSAQASLHLICYAHAAGCMHHLYSMPLV